ncbi:unnamed protein product [Parnassius apollo]|uniref:(apollo) hypothetical protein n=1 Tax=Parnassius apollo TaxID=110799 RepID=A0A8S3XQ55_PARAO|nr:unnamed protein product [Parnassius apollo]
MTTETATPNQADASTAFLRAARAGQIEKIINLLEQGVDINVSNALFEKSIDALVNKCELLRVSKIEQ